MLTTKRAFSGFSARDLTAERRFYADMLGLEVTEEMGNLMLDLPGGQRVVIYPKDDHEPATFTVLNFEVPDIDMAVDQLKSNGIEPERYDGFNQDDRGVVRDGGMAIAWFTDPSDNVLSIIQTG